MPQKPYRGLDQLMDGAITKRFNDELTRLWDNVYDMRAPATKAILYDIKSAPAAPEALQQTVFMRQRDDGSVQVTEQTAQLPGQIDMAGEEQPMPNVVEFKPSGEPAAR